MGAEFISGLLPKFGTRHFPPLSKSRVLGSLRGEAFHPP